MKNQLNRTIDYIKGKIKSYENAKKPMPYEKFDPNKINNLAKKLYHYRFILKILEKEFKNLED
jgi:hypothetical protein